MIAKIISSKFLWLAVAGAVGTLSRYGLGGLANRVFGEGAGWGTLAVNAVGCFLAGAVWILAGERGHLSPEMRAVILVGFMGAFTTFSAYVLETSEFLHGGRWIHAGRHLVLQNGCGISAFFAGVFAGRIF